MICSTLVHVFMPIILIRGAFEQCSVTGTAILTIGRHNRNTAGYMYVPINVALLNIRFTNSQNGSMQYFGKEPWLSTKTGGGVEIQELRRDSRDRRIGAPILILCFITVQICPTPRVCYSNLGNMSLMRAVCI